MIKIRNSLYETNSSSVHSISWLSYDKEGPIEENTETNFTNIIDVTDCHNKTCMQTFSEKVSFLYSFESTSENLEELIRLFCNELNRDGKYLYLDDFYRDNMHIKDDINFREEYKKVKSTLIEVVEELSWKKVEFKNEYAYNYYSGGFGYIPSDNDKDGIREVLLNKNICIIAESDEDVDDNLGIYDKRILEELVIKRKKFEEEDKEWFSWFKKD